MPNSSASFAGSPADLTFGQKRIQLVEVTESSEKCHGGAGEAVLSSSAMPSLLQVPHQNGLARSRLQYGSTALGAKFAHRHAHGAAGQQV